MVVIDRSARGTVRGTNLLAVYPDWEWLGLVSPMPMFFVAAGWANARSTPATAVRRLRVLIGTSAVVIVAWSLLSIGELLITHRSDVLGDGAHIATQPLWFLAAYVPFAGWAHVTARFTTHIAPFILMCVAIVTISDVSRFVFDAPRWIGYPGFFATWIIPWSLGMWWRDAHETGARDEKTIGVALVAIGIIASAVLVRFFDYTPSLIDAVPGHRSNTTPPTLFTCAAALAQAGLVMWCGQWLDGVAARRRHLLSRFNAASLGIYVWHLSAVVLCAALIALGVPMPTRFSLGWWIMRVPWFGTIIAVTAALVWITQLFHRHSTRDLADDTPSPRVIASGVSLVTIGATLTGLYGPRSLPLASAMTGCFVGGWFLLSARATPRE